MIKMASSLKYLIMLSIWAGIFFASYENMTSKKEEQLVTIHQTVSHMQDWSSYRTLQTIFADGEKALQLESAIQSNPDLIWVDSKTKLTDTEDFHFETFFQSDVILVHMFNPETWKKVDYTHPVAGELQGSKEPLEFWLRILSVAQNVTLEEKGTENEYYNIELKPFRDEIHGIRFEDVQSANMKIWMSKEPRIIKKMLLHVEFKPMITRLYDKLDYQIEFSDFNQPMNIHVPTEGMHAPKLQ